jgi:hypothetical protein
MADAVPAAPVRAAPEDDFRRALPRRNTGPVPVTGINSALRNRAKRPIDWSAAAESTAAPPATPVPDPGVEVTASGFRVRQRKGPAITMPSVTLADNSPPPDPGPTPAQAADRARSTLSAFMGGVDRGRREVGREDGDGDGRDDGHG